MKLHATQNRELTATGDEVLSVMILHQTFSSPTLPFEGTSESRAGLRGTARLSVGNFDPSVPRNPAISSLAAPGVPHLSKTLQEHQEEQAHTNGRRFEVSDGVKRCDLRVEESGSHRSEAVEVRTL